MSDSSRLLEDLVGRSGSGDRAAFGRLYEATSAKLFGIIVRICRDRGLAEDVLQETYVKIWRSAASYDPSVARPVSWMAAIARNSAIDQIRRKAEPRPAADDNELQAMLNVAARPGGPDFADAETLRRCLATLDSEHRRCILLAYYDGFSREELATEFERPVGTIKTWLHRALASLKSCMEAT